MVQNLINYIQQQLKNGYTQPQIKKALLKYGYPQYQINQAFSSINKPKSKPAIKPAIKPTIKPTQPNLNLNFLKNIHISKNIIFITIAIIILVTGTLVVLNLDKGQQSKTTTSSTELTLAAIKTTVQPGESISFSRKIHNFESY